MPPQPSADGNLSKAAAKEGVHRSVIVERALAKELQVSVDHKDPGYLERALEHLVTAERLLFRLPLSSDRKHAALN